MRNRPYFNKYNHFKSFFKKILGFQSFKKNRANPNVIPQSIKSINYQLRTEAVRETDYEQVKNRWDHWTDSIAGVYELRPGLQLNFADKLGTILIFLSVFYLAVFGFQIITHDSAERETLAIAEKQIQSGRNQDNPTPPSSETDPGTVTDSDHDKSPTSKTAKASQIKVIGTMEIPKLKRKVPIVEGTDAQALMRGAGHMTISALPGDGEQIVISGHNDTVFRKFKKIKVGDRFIVNMPYGKFTYQIKSTKIVSKDDKTVVRKMGQEVLVVTTCYPFVSNGAAPKRFVAYAYPVEKGKK